MIDGSKKVAYGVYFSFDKNSYKHVGKYLYVCALTIKNPYITENQFYSTIITKDKKTELYKNKFDSVVLVRENKIVEIVCFLNSQIKIHEIWDMS